MPQLEGACFYRRCAHAPDSAIVFCTWPSQVCKRYDKRRINVFWACKPHVNCLGFQLFLENLLNIGLFLDISRELSDFFFFFLKKRFKYSGVSVHVFSMGGPPGLHGTAYVIRLYSQVKNQPDIQRARQYVRSAIHDVGTVESFERISKSLALDTNIGRLLMIYLYGEELKEILPEKTTEIDRIRDQCLETGLLEVLVKGGSG